MQFAKKIASIFIDFSLQLNARITTSKQRYILCYHRVLTNNEIKGKYIHHSMWLTPDSLERQINWMKSIGKIVGINTITDYSLKNNLPWFSITFDDGWLDNYNNAFPLLKRHRIPATIFLATGAIDSGNLFWVDEFIEKTQNLFFKRNYSKLYLWLEQNGLWNKKIHKQSNAGESLNIVVEALKKLDRNVREAVIRQFYDDFYINPAPIIDNLMSWANVKEMSLAGINFQSHTRNHEILETASDELITRELLESKYAIETKLGKPVWHFCYPNARYNINKTELIKQAGYRFAYKIDNEPVKKTDNPYLIPRILVCERYSDLRYLRCRLYRIPFF